MKILTTFGEILRKGDWSKFCDDKGYSEYMLKEGLAESSEVSTIRVLRYAPGRVQLRSRRVFTQSAWALFNPLTDISQVKLPYHDFCLLSACFQVRYCCNGCWALAEETIEAVLPPQLRWEMATKNPFC